MEVPFVSSAPSRLHSAGARSCASSSPSSPFTSSSNLHFSLYSCDIIKICGVSGRRRKREIATLRPVMASGGQGSDGLRKGGTKGGEVGFHPTQMEVTTIDGSFGNPAVDFPVWDKIGAVVRVSYGIGIYGSMCAAGKFICSLTGIDSMGGFNPSLDALLAGLGYAAPPIMALLFILDDEVVKLSPHARAIRDVEDEELRTYFYGMSPWQFMLIVAASSVGEELFYRAAVQGALADIFLRGTELLTDTRGMASLTGVLPSFVPFAQAFAAAVTAFLTASLYYVAASPEDPAYIVTAAPQSASGLKDLKQLFTAWYEKRRLKKIYSPLLEGILALYLGFEWIQTDNILSPIITHGIYSAVILGHGLRKIHDHRKRLRQRIRQVKSEVKGDCGEA